MERHPSSEFAVRSDLRREELSFLEEILLKKDQDAVVIVGAPGTGKTALAASFGQEHGDIFTGGVSYIPPLEFAHSASTTLLKPDKRALIIIDDYDLVSGADLARIRRQYPYRNSGTKLIFTSNHTREHHSELTGVPILALAGLSRRDIGTLLNERLGEQFEKAIIEPLYSEFHGNPRTILQALEYLQAKGESLDDIASLLNPFECQGLLSPDGTPLLPESREYHLIVSDVREVSQQLLDQLAKTPEKLYELSPRVFEKVVAELLSSLGYDVTLTPASRDGGKDIYASTKTPLGSFLYYIECKKYAPDQPVGVGLIRTLHGVVQAEKATAGILATTSFFTKGAREFQSRVAFQISLQDYFGIQDWLHKALKGRPPGST